MNSIPNSLNNLDAINIILMLLSLVIAYIIPFELFLFSYAVLGPLHYLTEIRWLHQRSYFIPKDNSKFFYGFLAVTAVLVLLLSYSQFILFAGPATKESPLYSQLLSVMDEYRFPKLRFEASKVFVFILGLAAILVILKRKWQIVTAMAFLILIAFFWQINSRCISCTSKFNNQNIEKCHLETNDDVVSFVKNNCADLNSDGMLNSKGDLKEDFTYHSAFMFFSVYLPTLIHVYLFTLAFMLYGALKSRSKTGILAVITMGACGIIPFVFSPDGFGYAISDIAKRSYDVSFLELNQIIFQDLNISESSEETIYHSGIGVMIARFIAFAYTYHYLNWFSKTSVIKWHKIPVGHLAIILVIWILSVGLYVTDYLLGLRVLIFLSFLHVCLEFPLNWASFKGIFQEIRT